MGATRSVKLGYGGRIASVSNFASVGRHDEILHAMESPNNAVSAGEKSDEDITTADTPENLSPTAISRVAENVRKISLIREDIERIATHPTYGFLRDNPKTTESVVIELEDLAKNHDNPEKCSVRSISYETLVDRYKRNFEQNNDATQSSGTRWTTFRFLSLRRIQNNDMICALWFWRIMCLILTITIVVLVIMTRVPVKNVYHIYE